MPGLPVKTKYPWELWTNKSMHTIYRGTDFEISVYNMQISLHGRAKSRGMKVQTSSFKTDESEGLVFKFEEKK